jgi:hypothetical protein
LADNGLEAGIELASLDATDHATRANGYDASILIDLCKAILATKAAGKLSSSLYDKMAAQAQIILQ